MSSHDSEQQDSTTAAGLADSANHEDPPAPPDAETRLYTQRRASRSSSLTVSFGFVAVVAAWIVLELWGLGSAPFHTKGEPREALVVWEMTHGGSWVLPKRNGTELPSKPPLFHWLGAMTSFARGSTDEWSIRFPSAALSLFGALGVFAAASALWTPTAGLIAALSLLTTFEWARAATSARVDMTLTVGLEAAFLGFLFFFRTRRPQWLVVMYAGIAFAALGKGPVGVILPAAVAFVTIVASREFATLRQMHLLRGTVAVIVIAGSWYLLALELGGAAFFQKQVLNENILRFLGTTQFSGGHRHSNSTLFGLALLGLMPWTLFMPAVGAALWKNRRNLSFRGGELYCLAWIVVVCAFYAFAASKRSVYLLAIYPAVTMLLGWSIASAVRRRSVTLQIAGFVAAIVIGVLLAAVTMQLVGLQIFELVANGAAPRDRVNVLAVAQAVVAEPRSTLACLATAVVALLAFAAAAGRGHRLAACGSLFAAVASIIVLIRLAILPVIARQETLRDFITEARAAAGPGDAMFFYRTFDYGAVFYSQGHLPTYDGEFPSDAKRFLLMSRSEWERLRASAVSDYEQVRLPSDPRRLVLVHRTSEFPPE